MALVTQSVIVVLLCALSQCSAAGTVSISTIDPASLMVMEGGTLSVCVEGILDNPGDRVNVGLSSNPAGKDARMVTLC